MAFDPNYFRLPRPFPAFISIFTNILIFLSIKMPDSFLLDWYGPLGRYGRYLAYNHYYVLQYILYFAVTAHALEATFARIISMAIINVSTNNSPMIRAQLFKASIYIILIFFAEKIKKGLTTSAANKWMIQTFLIGFPSLLVLVPYKRGRKDA